MPTFVVGHDAFWNLDHAKVRDVACSWLEEEKRFRWLGVGQFLDVPNIISANGDDLGRSGWGSLGVHRVAVVVYRPSFPWKCMQP